MFFHALWLSIQSVNILCYSLIHLQFLRASDAKLIFLKVNFQVTDLSKDGLPRVKVFIPDSMPQATVMIRRLWLSFWRIPRLVGWPVLRSFVIPPMHPNLFRSKTKRNSSWPHGTGIETEHLEHELLVWNVAPHLNIYTFSCHKENDW